jgi:large repetitive protein
MAQNKSTLDFQTESLPGFHVGQPVNFAIQAVGGNPPYSFKVTSGSLSPLTMDTNGVIKGTPQAAGSSTVAIALSDSNASTKPVTQAFDVQIQAQSKKATR